MTQNIAVTPGTGATIAADLVGGALMQQIKLNLGATNTDGGLVSVSNPLPISSPGSVNLTNTPTVTAGAYTTGQVVGGLISLSGAARFNSGSGIIQTVSVTKKTNLPAQFDVFFFHTNPTNSTFTDNSALALNVADIPYCFGVAHCDDAVSCGTPQMLQQTNCAIPFKISAANTTLYAVMVIRGSESYASTSAVVLNITVLQD